VGTLVAEDLASDPRVAEAKRLVLAALADHQRRIGGIRTAHPAREADYADQIRDFGSVRGGSLYFPYLGSGIGRGPLVELGDGSVKYDFISGIGVHHWGHSNPRVVEACLGAALRDTVMQGNLEQNLESAEVSRLFLDAANRRGAALAHCFLTSSGAMANENALKIVFQKKSPASRLLSFEGCFAGRTLALSQITDKPAFRSGLPTTLAVDYIPFFDPEHPDESTETAVRVLRQHLRRYPGEHAAMVFELVQGEGGFHVGHRDFFRPLMEAAREAGAAVVVDEIQTFGRTSEFFAFQHFGLDPYVDVATVGKMTHVCATLFRDELRPRPGLVSQTFTASTSALATARFVLSELASGDYFGPDGKNASLHAHFEARLQATARQRPDRLQGPFGIGAMVAFTPFGGKKERVEEFVQALFRAGVIAFTAGTEPTRVRFLVPAGAVEREDVDRVMDIVEKTLAELGD
jgi:4-aminobutyrate aminotransferase-like enzyme